MKTVSVDFARELIDYAPTSDAKRMGFGESQLDGAVAAYNMLARNSVAYLADEVGMGKTYVALGVLGMMRHLNPRLRAMIIAPRENIQRKWEKELRNFVHGHWRVEDNHVRNLAGGPVRAPLVCSNFEEVARALRINDHRDLVLRMTSFSLACKSHRSRKRYRARLRPLIPWADRGLLSPQDPSQFRDGYGRLLNALLPPIDLLIVDEAHNLKQGFGAHVSNRNRILGLALGHPDGDDGSAKWYGRRVRHVLLLSATPFEYDYSDLLRQLDVLGASGGSVRDAGDGNPIRLSRLGQADVDESTKREIARRLLIRRVAYLNINGRRHSKNMYRREWRRGGLETHDEPIVMNDPKQRLVVGLMQKKVSEVLGDRRFNNHFQIGMLSSFESFLESLEGKGRASKAGRAAGVPAGDDGGAVDEDGEDDEELDQDRVFDGNQEAREDERRGIDTPSVEEVVRSYRERFGRGLPHPKLDQTVAALEPAFDTGEKALVFVRRVATVTELRRKLEDAFDRWIRRRMEAFLPDLASEIDGFFSRYARQRRRSGPVTDVELELELEDSAHPGADEPETDLVVPLEEDRGGVDSFFAWFFRGEGPRGVLSGAAFQKNRLASTSSAYSILFEDDHVGWLLGGPKEPVRAIAEAVGASADDIAEDVRRSAFAYYRERTRQKEGYPRFYVYEACQHAGLRRLRESGGPLADRAEVVLRMRYGAEHDPLAPDEEVPAGFPKAEETLGRTTFFTALRRKPELCDQLWPVRPAGEAADLAEFEARFRDQECRRELLSAMARLGATYIDLYCLAIGALGSFEPKTESDVRRPEEALASAFVDLLERQSRSPGFGAYHELASAAASFDLIQTVNFPEARAVSHEDLAGLAEVYGRSLQHQVPVGGMSGAVNKRLVRQFRMPGFPLILVTTDVLQEGEDLHTFCRRVVHYGITWTPSAMEQRTGRVDRIGGLVQRQLDGANRDPSADELIQVFLPHLQDTVEVLQVRRVLERLHAFLVMVHEKPAVTRAHESRVDVSREVVRPFEDLPRVEGLLKSAFPVEESPWLEGRLDAAAIRRPDIGALEESFHDVCRGLVAELRIRGPRHASKRRFEGSLLFDSAGEVWTKPDDIDPDPIEQGIRLDLRSQEVGGAALVRCVAPVGRFELPERAIDTLYGAHRAGGLVKLCAHHEATKNRYELSVETDRLFHLETLQPEEIEDIVRRASLASVAIRLVMFGDTERADAFSSRIRAPRSTAPRDSAHARLAEVLRCVLEAHPDEWIVSAESLRVATAGGDRRQRIKLGIDRGDAYAVSRVLPASEVRSPLARWYELCLLTWQRNASQDLVTFGFDARDHLVARVRHPVEYLDPPELQVYLQALGREADRFEYLLSGQDRY